jgi:hypothetical protein
MRKCSPFQKNPALLIAPSQFKFSLSFSIFQEFVSALEWSEVKITDTDFTDQGGQYLRHGIKKVSPPVVLTNGSPSWMWLCERGDRGNVVFPRKWQCREKEKEK